MLLKYLLRNQDNGLNYQTAEEVTEKSLLLMNQVKILLGLHARKDQLMLLEYEIIYP
jgi:hypothetical protein